MEISFHSKIHTRVNSFVKLNADCRWLASFAPFVVRSNSSIADRVEINETQKKTRAWCKKFNLTFRLVYMWILSTDFFLLPIHSLSMGREGSRIPTKRGWISKIYKKSCGDSASSTRARAEDEWILIRAEPQMFYSFGYFYGLMLSTTLRFVYTLARSALIHHREVAETREGERWKKV